MALLLYNPKNSQIQNIFITIIVTDLKEQLVFKDIVKVIIEAAKVSIKTDGWRSSQLTEHHHQKPTKGLDQRQLYQVVQPNISCNTLSGVYASARLGDLLTKCIEVLQLKENQQNHCAACNIKQLWAYQPKNTQQKVCRLVRQQHVCDKTCCGLSQFDKGNLVNFLIT